MKINLIYTKDSWILDRMSQHLIDQISEIAPYPLVNKDDLKKVWRNPKVINESKVINYFIYYKIIQQKTKGIDVGFFTHPQDRTFYNKARLVDYCVNMAPQYNRELLEIGCKSHLILPGIDSQYKPKLILGFPANINSHKGRKCADLVTKVQELDFVEFRVTNKQYAYKDLPRFYHELDYVLITSKLEGGPMALLEGLSCGKEVICPHSVGLAEEFTEHIYDYEAGSFESLIKVLRMLYEKKIRISKSVEQLSWKKWADDHRDLFRNIWNDRYKSKVVS